MHAPYRSVRKNYPKIDFEICFLPEGPLRYLGNPRPVFREDTIVERSLRHSVPSLIEPKQVVDFGGPIYELSAPHVPGPTARINQPLGFSQIGLAASHFPFRLPGGRDIGNCSDKLDAT